MCVRVFKGNRRKGSKIVVVVVGVSDAIQKVDEAQTSTGRKGKLEGGAEVESPCAGDAKQNSASKSDRSRQYS